jgi:hypothetical protein
VAAAKRVTRLSELRGAALPLLVALSGRAVSEAPVACEHAEGVRACIYECAVEQQFLKQADNGEWLRDAALVAHVLREAPWFLARGGTPGGAARAWRHACGHHLADPSRFAVQDDDSGERVWVVGATSAGGLRLATVHDGFEPSARGVLKAGAEFLRGLRVLGTRTTERALPVGAPLCAVGELLRASDGALQLRRPAAGRPWFVTTRSLEALGGALGASARVFRLLSLGCTTAGVALIAARALQHLRAKRRAAALRRRVQAHAAAQAARRQAAAADGGAALDATAAALLSGSDAEEEDADGDSSAVPASQLCVICLEREHDAVFRDCGHLAACITCAARLNKVRRAARALHARGWLLTQAARAVPNLPPGGPDTAYLPRVTRPDASQRNNTDCTQRPQRGTLGHGAAARAAAHVLALRQRGGICGAYAQAHQAVRDQRVVPTAAGGQRHGARQDSGHCEIFAAAVCKQRVKAIGTHALRVHARRQRQQRRAGAVVERAAGGQRPGQVQVVQVRAAQLAALLKRALRAAHRGAEKGEDERAARQVGEAVLPRQRAPGVAHVPRQQRRHDRRAAADGRPGGCLPHAQVRQADLQPGHLVQRTIDGADAEEQQQQRGPVAARREEAPPRRLVHAHQPAQHHAARQQRPHIRCARATAQLSGGRARRSADASGNASDASDARCEGARTRHIASAPAPPAVGGQSQARDEARHAVAGEQQEQQRAHPQRAPQLALGSGVVVAARGACVQAVVAGGGEHRAGHGHAEELGRRRGNGHSCGGATRRVVARRRVVTRRRRRDGDGAVRHNHGQLPRLLRPCAGSVERKS